MEIIVFPNAETVAARAAVIIAELSGDAIKKRGQFTFAVSGGTTPWLMLNHLAKLDIAWDKIHIFQVDERVAPSGDRSRNWTHLSETLLSQVKLPEAQTHGIPVNMTDLEAAAAHYSATLCSVAGTPAVLDLVHLGLGADGHTASLVPNDKVLSVHDADVAVTAFYQNQRRVTLTYPLIDRARHILWVVVGADKQCALKMLLHGDRSIPAGRVNGERATVLADSAAIGSADVVGAFGP